MRDRNYPALESHNQDQEGLWKTSSLSTKPALLVEEVTLGPQGQRKKTYRANGKTLNYAFGYFTPTLLKGAIHDYPLS